MNTPAITELRSRGIPHRIFQHNGPIESLEQAAIERSQRPEQVIRSLVFRLADADFIMVLMPGPGQVPWKALRRYLNTSRLTMASEEELLAATGCQPGTVNPFGLPRPMRVLIDRCIIDLPEVSLGSGQRGLAILITPADLMAALPEKEVVDFSAAC
jgi:Cys-tRNA(Pro)/Cys-tRNA(Cys) deacylase